VVGEPLSPSRALRGFPVGPGQRLIVIRRAAALARVLSVSTLLSCR
jgi:hypothetical protein